MENKQESKQYFTYKYTQLFLGFVIAILTIIFVALPQTLFNIKDGIEILVIYTMGSYFTNGIKQPTIKQNNKEVNNEK